MIEVLFKIIGGLSVFNFSLIRIFLYINILTAILTFILNLLPDLIRKIVLAIIALFSTGYAAAQLGFMNFLGVYISFQTSSQLGAVVDYIIDFIKSFKFIYYLEFIPFILTTIYLFKFDKSSSKLNIRVSAIISAFILLITVPLFYFTVVNKKFQNKLQTVSNKTLFLTANNPSYAIDQFGTNGFLFLDVKQLIIPHEVEELYIVKKKDKPEKEQNDLTRKIDDSIWKLVSNDEKNNTYLTLNDYFMNQSITDKNEYTGLFQDKNLIVIMMESVNDILINPEYYPNFYKLITEGWNFENYYSPRNSCATINNEFSGMTSLYSISNMCTANNYKNNIYPNSIFNLFNDKNYVTFSLHDYTEAYYARSTIHKNMGSGEYFGIQKLGIPWKDEYEEWANDDEFIESYLKILDDKMENEEHFMSWLTTVTSHQPYSISSSAGDKYYSMTDGTNYPKDIRRYMSKLKVLDDGLGILLQGLEERNILDDTVIVLYGDHYPYGLSTTNINKVLDYDTSKDNTASKVPFVIYNSKMEPKVYSKYTTYVNILPTLANLFNLDYDPRLYVGTDLFDKDYESLVVFADGSWKNEFAYYDASKNKVKYYQEDVYTEEDINRITTEVATKLNVSKMAITSNYFYNLKKSIDKKVEDIKQAESAMTTTTTTKVTTKKRK